MFILLVKGYNIWDGFSCQLSRIFEIIIFRFVFIRRLEPANLFLLVFVKTLWSMGGFLHILNKIQNLETESGSFRPCVVSVGSFRPILLSFRT